MVGPMDPAGQGRTLAGVTLKPFLCALKKQVCPCVAGHLQCLLGGSPCALAL